MPLCADFITARWDDDHLRAFASNQIRQLPPISWSDIVTPTNFTRWEGPPSTSYAAQPLPSVPNANSQPVPECLGGTQMPAEVVMPAPDWEGWWGAGHPWGSSGGHDELKRTW